jgi:hypothetical protein
VVTAFPLLPCFNAQEAQLFTSSEPPQLLEQHCQFAFTKRLQPPVTGDGGRSASPAPLEVAPANQLGGGCAGWQFSAQHAPAVPAAKLGA